LCVADFGKGLTFGKDLFEKCQSNYDKVIIMATNQVIPSEIWAVFCGPIDQNAVQKIFQGFATAMSANVKKAHLLFQSTGGMVGDGICLYNYFQALPLELTIYNAGAVQSIAVVAYLGAHKRKTSARATFMIHRTMYSPQPADAYHLEIATNIVTLDDRRTDSILRDHIKLSDDQWANLGRHDLTFSAEEAVNIGMANEIGEFTPPPGCMIYTI
jgi:ATP-dependent Clp protease, protease subunit